MHFLYADDLNIPRVETALKRLLHTGTSADFYPPNAGWISCTTPNFRPHSNECGPRTMLALAVMVSHPAQHPAILHPYISTNLAQYSRHWMCIVLLTGSIPLLPHSAVTQTNKQSYVHSVSATLINWHNNQTDQQDIDRHQLPSSLTQKNQDIEIVSPIHQLITTIQAAQQSPHTSSINQGNKLSNQRSI